MNDVPRSADISYHVRRLVDHVPSMLAYWDRDLNCRFANRAYEHWFGVNPDSLIGTSIRDLLGPELFALNEPYIRGALRGEVQEFERVVPGPGGVKRHSLARYLPDVVNGEVVGFMAEVTEVTRLKDVEAALRAEVAERARAYELLRASEAALREAQRLGQIGSWEWDAATGLTTWSDQLYAIFGYDTREPPPEATVQGRSQLYPPESMARLQPAVLHTLQTGAPFALELEYQRRDGARGWIEARGEAVCDAQGKPVKLRGTVHEITLRREMQEARLQRDVAEAASRNKTQFLSRVSHELRTPLNAILGFAQLCEHDATLGLKHREWAQHIRVGGQHMLDLIDEILDLSGAELGHTRVTSVEMDLTEAVRHCMTQLSEVARASHLHLDDRLPREPLRVMADPMRVRQVIQNLLSNAIKYNRPGGTVTLSAELQGPTVALRVQDSGIGLNAAQLARLFTPFDRLGAEATGVQGSGIGLALSRKLVELMDGRIEVQSEPGVGSVFTVVLPSAGA
jgi:PAS domain S-box-containing protein